MRNVLTNVLGARDQVDVHVAEHDVEPGDVDAALQRRPARRARRHDASRRLPRNQKDIQLATRQMVDAALDNGSRDNVTALLVRIDGEPA